jgi:hypothetical protein
MNTKNKQSVKTQTTKRNRSKRNVKVIKSQRNIESMTITVNSEAMDFMFSKMPPQLQNILDYVETFEGGRCTVKDLNTWWISAFMDTDICVQDAVTVLNHYTARFNKSYKGFKPEELNTLFTLTN